MASKRGTHRTRIGNASPRVLWNVNFRDLPTQADTIARMFYISVNRRP